MTSDRERLELIQIFLVNVTQIENLDETLRETKATIKRQRDQLLADNERILERLRNRDDRRSSAQTGLPFQASPTGDPDELEEEEEESESDDDDVEVDVLIEQEPPAAQPEGGLQ
jgi:hypothetical protein